MLCWRRIARQKGFIRKPAIGLHKKPAPFQVVLQVKVIHTIHHVSIPLFLLRDCDPIAVHHEYIFSDNRKNGRCSCKMSDHFAIFFLTIPDQLNVPDSLALCKTRNRLFV
jgi:hypothetical protein